MTAMSMSETDRPDAAKVWRAYHWARIQRLEGEVSQLRADVEALRQQLEDECWIAHRRLDAHRRLEA